MSNVTPATDPSVVIPPAVRAAAARADAMMAPPQEAPQEAPQEGNGGAQADAAPEQLPLFSDQPTPAPAPAQPQPEQGEDKQAQNIINSMKGRLQQRDQQVRELSEEVSRLHNLLAAVQLTTPSNPTPAVPSELRADRLLTQEERDEYGEELLSVVGKAAQEKLTPILRAYEAKIADLEGRLAAVGQSTLRSERQKMFDALDKELPNWRDINKHQKFLSWLALPDPYAGVMRKTLLKQAYDVNDTNRVLRFFQGFLADEAATRPAGTQVAASAPEPGPAKTDLSTLAAPGRAKSSAASAPDEKPVISRAQITQFYADVTAGKYRGREAEKDRIERMIHSAVNEGRLR